MTSLLVGVAGGSGSGKTTVAEALASHYKAADLQTIPLDAYYRDRTGMTPEEKARLNYDHPGAFDEPLLHEHLSALKRGETIRQPLYDYATHSRREDTIEVRPSRVVVLEGILVLAMDTILPLLDLKLFVDTEADVRFLRRMRRDVADRGRTPESVMTQYLESVRPMHTKFVAPTRAQANLIVPGEGDYDVVLEVLRAWVDAQLAR